MELIPGVQSSAQALQAEKIRLEVIAQNIANAQTTRVEGGGPYQRKMVAFEALMSKAGDGSVAGVGVAGIIPDTNPGPVVYAPTHPHANAEGMVQMPNVEISREMVDMLASSRAYEANLAAVKASRLMAKQALAIGKE